MVLYTFHCTRSLINMFLLFKDTNDNAPIFVQTFYFKDILETTGPSKYGSGISIKGPYSLPFYLFSYWRQHRELLWTVYIKIRRHRMCSLISDLHCPHFAFYIMNKLFLHLAVKVYILANEKTWFIYSVVKELTLYHTIPIWNNFEKEGYRKHWRKRRKCW